MKFKIDAERVNQGLKKSIHADDKYKGKKLDVHKPGQGHTKGKKRI